MGISDDVSMFYGAKPQIFEKATQLRNNMTQAEKLLWNKLKDRNLFPHKFRRQHPVDIFIVDFYCHHVKLVVEVDGDYHLNNEQAEYDIGRSAEIAGWGLKIIRFSNREVLQNLNLVVETIQKAIAFKEKEILSESGKNQVN